MVWALRLGRPYVYGRWGGGRCHMDDDATAPAREPSHERAHLKKKKVTSEQSRHPEAHISASWDPRPWAEPQHGKSITLHAQTR